MAGFAKAVQVSKTVNNVAKLFTNLSLSPPITTHSSPVFTRRCRITPCHSALLHTTARNYGLMEFFDDKKNWGKNEVKVGRAWRKDELRIKSNEDLHKLWFVLLKERNMLLTMEEACNQAFEIFPNPERTDKVNESMANIETVVRERNQAYHLLETGELGERPVKLVYSPLGIRYLYRMRQYSIPSHMNLKWRKTHEFGYNGHAVRKFLRLYREKLWNEKRKARNRESNVVLKLMKKFPNMDLEAVKKQYPSVNIEKLKERNDARGHYVPN